MDIVEVGMDKEHVERHVLSREEVIPGHMLALEVRSSSVSKIEVGIGHHTDWWTKSN